MTHTIEGRLPLVAILRGLEPERAADVGETLVECGFDIIEVPLNSPDPLTSIAALVTVLGNRALIGAGTVLTEAQVDALADIGAGLVVSPNCNPAVIRRTAAHGMVSLPGVITPTEMFAALDAGATGLKIFPAEMVSPAIVKAVRAVLPAQVPVYAVGGINALNMGEYLGAGAAGFGIGGSLFKPGKPLPEIAADARAIVAAFKAAQTG
ncbi:MAG TPA: 2-dehydro-3-deoxy-6-phosphogalactonate aldolase [Erythrobacter sp.]|nr:2-dehydro-3-deoxy-6-phosphogalactonate aldolase [Erythrobacter sp.]